MVPLGDVAQVEARFSLFGDSANLHARLVYGLRRTYHTLENHFGRARRNSLVTWVVWNLTSSHLETVLVSVQDRCIVYARCTVGLQIVLDTPNGTTR